MDIRMGLNLGQLISLNTSDQYGMINHSYTVVDPTVSYLVMVTPNMTQNGVNDPTLLVYIGADVEPTPYRYDWKILSGEELLLIPKYSNTTRYFVGVQSAEGG